MFDYDCDYENYYEPKEIEEALNEFKDGIYKMLNKDIAEKIESQECEIDSLKQQLKVKNEKLSNYSTDVRKAEEKGRDGQTDKLFGEFKHGDIVYIVKNTSKKKDCSFCEKGKLIGKNGEKIKCPKCYGSGNEQYWELEVVETKIKKIAVSIENSTYGKCRITHTSYYTEDNKEHSRNRDDVFKSKIDAEEELKRERNKKR